MVEVEEEAREAEVARGEVEVRGEEEDVDGGVVEVGADAVGIDEEDMVYRIIMEEVEDLIWLIGHIIGMIPFTMSICQNLSIPIPFPMIALPNTRMI